MQSLSPSPKSAIFLSLELKTTPPPGWPGALRVVHMVLHQVVEGRVVELLPATGPPLRGRPTPLVPQLVQLVLLEDGLHSRPSFKHTHRNISLATRLLLRQGQGEPSVAAEPGSVLTLWGLWEELLPPAPPGRVPAVVRLRGGKQQRSVKHMAPERTVCVAAGRSNTEPG
ncbi:hypothetical protein INR49_018766 [Caranx melampygus]|nr:hypothetical protein INR49_018766 [Caranx melampygus]